MRLGEAFLLPSRLFCRGYFIGFEHSKKNTHI